MSPEDWVKLLGATSGPAAIILALLMSGKIHLPERLETERAERQREVLELKGQLEEERRQHRRWEQAYLSLLGNYEQKLLPLESDVATMRGYNQTQPGGPPRPDASPERYP